MLLLFKASKLELCGKDLSFSFSFDRWSTMDWFLLRVGLYPNGFSIEFFMLLLRCAVAGLSTKWGEIGGARSSGGFMVANFEYLRSSARVYLIESEGFICFRLSFSFSIFDINGYFVYCITSVVCWCSTSGGLLPKCAFYATGKQTLR